MSPLVQAVAGRSNQTNVPEHGVSPALLSPQEQSSKLVKSTEKPLKILFVILKMV